MRMSSRRLILAGVPLAAGLVIWAIWPGGAGDAAVGGSRATSDGTGSAAGRHGPARVDPPETIPRIPPSAAEIARGGAVQGRVQLRIAGTEWIDRESPVPAGMLVELGPSRFVAGGEGAATRRLEVGNDLAFATEGLPFASYELRAIAPGWSGAPSTVVLSPTQPFADVTLRAMRCPDLLGYLRDRTRAPVEGVTIVCAGRTDRGDSVSHETRTIGDGSFRFEAIEDGSYRIEAGPPGELLLDPRPIAVRDGRAPDVVLEVPPLAALAMRVVVQGIDVPIEGFLVSVARRGRGATSLITITGDDGRADFRNLLPGPYSVVATRDDFRAVNAEVVLEEGATERFDLNTIPLIPELLPSHLFAPVPPAPTKR